MQIDLEILSIQNPWWVSLGGVDRQTTGLRFDPVIESYENSGLDQEPDFLKISELVPGRVNVLYGPRGLGKTTFAKLAIKKLIEIEKVNPDNIFYYSCHNLDTFEQLNEIIKIFLKWRQPTKPECLFLFIDEISLVKNWQKGMRYLFESGKFKKASVALLVSILDKNILKEKKWQPKIATSLDFGNFLNLINSSLSKKIKPSNFLDFQEQLEYYQDIYFLTGGFIPAISEFKNRGSVSQEVYSNYLYWLIADIAKFGRDPILARQIMEKIIDNLGQPIGWQTVAKKTKAKSHATIADYLEILESMFALKMVYQLDGKKFSTAKAKKVYFRDPFLFWLFYAYIGGALNYWQFSREKLHRQDVFSLLVENVIFSHLIKDEALAVWGRRVSYWRSNTKNLAIDFVVNCGKKICPILIRYHKKISEQDRLIFKKAGFKKGIIISDKELDLSGSIKIVPLTYFLMFYKEILK